MRGDYEAALLHAFCGGGAVRELRLAAPQGKLRASLRPPPLPEGAEHPPGLPPEPDELLHGLLGPLLLRRRDPRACLDPLRVVEAGQQVGSRGGGACQVSVEQEPAPIGCQLDELTVLTLRK